MSEKPTRERMYIRKWIADKGYGFARKKGDNTGRKEDDTFVHARALCEHLFDNYAQTTVPIIDADGRPDYSNSPWPDVYAVTEPNERGTRAVSAVCAECAKS